MFVGSALEPGDPLTLPDHKHSWGIWGGVSSSSTRSHLSLRSGGAILELTGPCVLGQCRSAEGSLVQLPNFGGLRWKNPRLVLA